MCKESIQFYQTGIKNINATIEQTPLTDPLLFYYFETLVKFETLLAKEFEPVKPTLFNRLKNLVN